MILESASPMKFSNLTRKFFPIETQGVIDTLGVFGYTLFMFLIGVKTDLSTIKTTGKKAFAAGILSLTVPAMVGIATTQSLIKRFTAQDQNGSQNKSLFFIVGLHAVSPFPVVALLLKDLNILNSQLGRFAISSAASSELLSTSVMFSVNTFKLYQIRQSLAVVLEDMGLAVCFIIVVICVIQPAMIWVIKQMPEGRPVKESYLYSIILAVFLTGAFSHWIRKCTILGPFILGLAMPDGSPLGTGLVDKLYSFVSGLFLPLFMTLIALRGNLQAIDLSSPSVVSTIVLVTAMFLVKVSACMLPTWISGVLQFKDALALGFIMNAKGMIQLSSYCFFRDDRAFSEAIFALLVGSMAATAVLAPIFVKQLYNPSRKYAGYQRRNIMHSAQGSEMRIVMCIHRPDNVPAFINLLDISSRSRENPIMVYVLHLIKLHGRATPLFISHQFQQKNNHSCFEDVVFAFSRYERQLDGSICMRAFTAISPRKLMHEDICTLALDKLAALVVIPFHRKWAVDGSIEPEDFALRSLNCKILDMAPCSIGILVDHEGRHQGYHSTTAKLSSKPPRLRIAVMFFGGNDDREALVYAKRMARNPGITLTVVQFTAMVNEGLDEGEKKLDSVVLNDVNSIRDEDVFHTQEVVRDSLETAFTIRDVFYTEEVVRDRLETAFIIRDVADEFDFITVGRKKNVEFPQTSGLEKGSEFPELGVVGDILAASDLKCKASVSVFQQQQQQQQHT